MRKIICLMLVFSLVSSTIYAADTKLSALDELTAVADGDLIYVVDITDTSSKKMTILNLFDTIDTFAELNTIVADKTLANLNDAMTWVALGTFNLGITITTGDPFTLGTNRIDNGSDLLDGEMIAADTIQEPALNITNAGDAGIDNYLLSYNHAGTNFTWVAAGAGAGDLLADGSVPMTANWDIGNFDITLKSLTGDGTIEGATLTEGGNAVWNATETEIIDSDAYVDGSIDLVHLAAGVYAKDLVTTSPITGAADNIFVGADSDVTVALTMLKDLVTTAPVTGGTDNIFPGSDADITIALDFTTAWAFDGNLSIGNATTTAGVLTLLEDDDDGSNFASFMVPALAANTVYTLPPDDGDNTEVLQTNGSGVLTWVANAGGGATAWDDISNPDADDAIALAGYEIGFSSTLDEAGHVVFKIDHTDADITAATTIFQIQSVDDADADLTYIKIVDNSAAGGSGWLGIDSSHYDNHCGDTGTHTLEEALDGSDFWEHTENHTHFIILNLGQSYTITKVRGRSNIDGCDPIDVNIYVSDDKENWGAAVATGINSWQDTDSWIEENVTPKSGQYIKIEIIETESAVNWLVFGGNPEHYPIFDVYLPPPNTVFSVGADGAIANDGNITSGGTIEGATITEGGNAVYNSTETPGGILGGTWASPTIDADSIDSVHYAAGSIDEEHLNVTNAPGAGEDNYVLTYNHATTNFTWAPDADSGGSTAWDDISDPDNSGLTTITFDNAELTLFTGDNDAAASFITIQNSDADHTGGNLYLLDLDYSADDGDVDADFIKFQDSGSVVMTIQQNGEIATDGGITAGGTIEGAILTEGGNAVWNATETEIIDSDAYVDGSIDLVHLASAVYAKDIVTTSPITGGTDNVLVGADGDVTIAVTVAKDIVTTAPLTGAVDNVIIGTDADITLGIDVLKDLVTTAPVTGGTDNILPGSDADITIALDFTASWDFGGAAGFELPNAAAPTTNAAGEIALDTTITDHQPLWQYYDGGENMTLIAIDTAQLPALDNEIIKYDAASDKFVLEADAGAAGGDAWSDAVDSDILPTGADDTYDIGAADAQFKDGYFDGTLEADVLTEGGNAVPNTTDHLGFFGGTTSAELLAEISNETGSGVLVFGTAPTFTTSITITGADAVPDAAGEIQYDSTVTGMSGGALRWFDDDSVRLLVDLETDPTDDDYVVAYDSAADGFYMKADADTGGSTAWDDIGDPDAAATVDFVTYTQTIDIGKSDSGGGSGLILDVTGLGAGTDDVIALKITTATNDDTDYIPIAIYDDSGGDNDLLFKVTSNGSIILRTGAEIIAPTQVTTNEILSDSGGTLTIDCFNPNSDGTLTITNSEGGYVANVAIDGAITEGGNAVYNSTETPGGILGGTWASPTIDADSIDSVHYAAGSIDYEHLADDVISGAAAVGTFESGDTFLVLEAGVGLREVDFDDLPGAAGGDAWSDAVDSDILPTGADDTYDLGAAAAQFKDGYFDGTLEADVLTEGGVAVITEADMPAAGTDPDVDAAGELSVDTDGANEPNDVVLRTIDGKGTQVALAQEQKSIQATIIKPNDLADATRDACPIWSNETGMSFVVTKIEAWADTDDTAFNIEVVDADGTGNNATVDAINCITGSGPYTDTETTITAATIAANRMIFIDFDDTDDPGWVKISICGYFLADVD